MSDSLMDRLVNNSVCIIKAKLRFCLLSTYLPELSSQQHGMPLWTCAHLFLLSLSPDRETESWWLCEPVSAFLLCHPLPWHLKPPKRVLQIWLMTLVQYAVFNSAINLWILLMKKVATHLDRDIRLLVLEQLQLPKLLFLLLSQDIGFCWLLLYLWGFLS